MSPPNQHLNPIDAARRLGVSPKALRLYEQRGLLSPPRSAAGWRAYGPAEMARAAGIVGLRGLGLSLADIGRVLDGDMQGLGPALAAHQAGLERRMQDLAAAIGQIRGLRAGLDRGETPAAGALAAMLAPPRPAVAFDLPWPWGGERFDLRDIPALTWITGPLGSGKTRLARALATALPGGRFLGLDRRAADGGRSPAVARDLAWLAGDGATPSDALAALLDGIHAGAPGPVVIDMIEQGLDEATQAAVAAWARGRGPDASPIFAMTRSTAMLDLAAVGADEAIILCPANHAPPLRVAPWPGSPGYEAVAMCLAAPEVRARTAGVIAVRPPASASPPR